MCGHEGSGVREAEARGRCRGGDASEMKTWCGTGDSNVSEVEARHGPAGGRRQREQGRSARGWRASEEYRRRVRRCKMIFDWSLPQFTVHDAD
jgi:hypothetical protein